MTSRFKAMIFDMDGTLLDSMLVWRTVWREYIEKKGLKMPEELVGKSDYGCMKSCGLLAAQEGRERDEIYAEMRELIRAHYMTDIQPKPYAAELLAALKAEGYTVGVATATLRDMAWPALERHGLTKYLDFFCDVDEIGLSKSEPEFFVRASALAGARPEESVMFEDAVYAMRSAKAAGMPVVAIDEPMSYRDKEEIVSLADRYVLSWREVIGTLPVIIDK